MGRRCPPTAVAPKTVSSSSVERARHVGRAAALPITLSRGRPSASVLATHKDLAERSIARQVKAARLSSSTLGGHSMSIQQPAPTPDSSDASTNITGHPRAPMGTIPCSYSDLISQPHALQRHRLRHQQPSIYTNRGLSRAPDSTGRPCKQRRLKKCTQTATGSTLVAPKTSPLTGLLVPVSTTGEIGAEPFWTLPDCFGLPTSRDLGGSLPLAGAFPRVIRG